MSQYDSKEQAPSSLSRGSQHQTFSVTERRARAQREKLNKQAQKRTSQTEKMAKQVRRNETYPEKQTKNQSAFTIENAIDEYRQDHIGGNHSAKTLEWHATALGLLRVYLQEQQGITLIKEVTSADISAWFTYLRTTPGSRGKVRSERTVQTYARSARAFFHWLVRRGTLEHNPFDHVIFPKVGRPLIQTITTEEFEKLLLACTPPNEMGPFAERAAVRNRAILWLLYDTGIRVSELINLRLGDLDRKKGVVTVMGKGSKERRIALGQNCQRNLSYYLDKHRPGEEELAEWGSSGEDHLFLSETRQPLTKNGMEMLFKRLKARAGITGKRISPHIFRHTFAINYLIKSNDPFSLQELLGHEDLATVRLYMHMNDEIIQEQKRKYSPGDHLPAQIQEYKESRRTGFTLKERGKRAN
jgi:integrase/recombinase XerD